MRIVTCVREYFKTKLVVEFNDYELDYRVLSIHLHSGKEVRFKN